MTNAKQPLPNSGVTSGRIIMKHLFSTVLKEHVVVASSESNFFETEAGPDLSVLAVRIRLNPSSVEFALFQQQLAEAVAHWDSAYAQQLRAPGEAQHGEAIEPFWSHAPEERILLVFDGIEHVQEGPVYDFLYSLVNHPPENTAILLLTPSESIRGLRMNPEEARELKQAADWIVRGQLGELEAFFVQQGIRYTPPELTRQYLNLFRRIPEKEFEASPVLQLTQAALLSHTGQAEKAHYLLNRTALLLEAGEPSAEQTWALGEIYLLQSLLNMNLGISSYLGLLKKADRLLPAGSSLITRHTGMCMGNNNALIYQGFEKQDVYRILDTMYEADPYMLRLTKGFGYGRQYLASAEVYYYTGQFQRVKSSVQRGIGRAKLYSQWDLQCNAYHQLMRVAIAQGDYRAAVKHIKDMKECRLRYSEKEQQILHLPDLAQAELYLKIGEGQRVASWLLGGSRLLFAESPVYMGGTPIIHASCLMESGKLLEALDVTEKALQQFRRYKQFILSLQAYILKAILYSRIGEQDLAIMHLGLAYEMEAGNNFIMMFAEYGKHMAALLQYARDAKGHGIPGEWIDRLQSRAETYSRNLGHLRSTYLAIETGTATPTSLTRREKDAMELLCEGLSNQQIAERMGIKVTSLKTHLQRTYRKIGAENRADAVRLWLIAGKLTNCTAWRIQKAQGCVT